MKVSVYFVMVALLSSCGGSEEPAKTAPTKSSSLQAVRVVTVRQGPIRQGRKYLAEVVPTRTVRVLAQVPGTVSELSVAEGVPVKEGATLARIAAPDVAARIARVRAERKRAEREQSFACTQVKSDRVLARAGDLSSLQLERSEKGCAAAELAVEAARAAEREAAVVGTRAVERAPFSGEVLSLLVDEGQTVGPGTPLLHFASRERQLRLRVPRGDLEGIVVGARVVIRDGAGRVAQIGAQAQGPGRLIELLVDLEPEEGLPRRPGTTTTATLVLDERLESTSVPGSALGGDGEATFLLIVEDGALRRVEARAGPRQDGWVAIEPRLPEGTQVVLRGADSLDLGRPVLAVTP